MLEKKDFLKMLNLHKGSDYTYDSNRDSANEGQKG
jgi:hypothetical protein